MLGQLKANAEELEAKNWDRNIAAIQDELTAASCWSTNKWQLSLPQRAHRIRNNPLVRTAEGTWQGVWSNAKLHRWFDCCRPSSERQEKKRINRHGWLPAVHNQIFLNLTSLLKSYALNDEVICIGIEMQMLLDEITGLHMQAEHEQESNATLKSLTQPAIYWGRKLQKPMQS